MLSSNSALSDGFYELQTSTKSSSKINGGVDVGVSLLKAKLGADLNHEKTTTSAIKAHTVEMIFQNVIMNILSMKKNKDGILIVIDEFDQITDATGFASYLKSLATNTPGLKFCIVGVAQNIQDLMKEHQSSDRLFAGSIINLPSMNPSELTSIIKTAEESIQNHITFDESAITKIVNLSKGHPYIVHLLGKQTLKLAFLEPVYIINEFYIDNVLKSIAEKESDPVLEGRYKKAIASSRQRELVLKAFANSVKGDEVNTSDAYRLTGSNVDNASQYVGQLVTDDYGAEIIKVRERYYRFKDSLFQTYVSFRPNIF